VEEKRMKHKWSVKLIITDTPVNDEVPYVGVQIAALFDNMDKPAGISIKILKPKKWKIPQRTLKRSA
jgi:hypothetical protein